MWNSDATNALFFYIPCSQHGQDTVDELRSKDYKHSLERKEKEARDQRQRERTGRAFTGTYDGVGFPRGRCASTWKMVTVRQPPP